MIVSPTTVTLNPQQSAGMPAFKLGDIIEAQVLQLINATTAKLAIGSSIIQVQTNVALTPGSTVRFAVKNTPDGLRLTLLPGAGSAPASGSAPAAASGVRAPDSPATLNTTSVAVQAAATAASGAGADARAAGQLAGATGAGAGAAGAGTPAAAANAMAAPLVAAPALPDPMVAATVALATAVQSSAARQGGLAPLFADAGVAATMPAVPEPVRQAAERLLALQPTLDESVSADTIKQALDQSGLFLEARLAAAAKGGPQTGGPQTGGTAAPTGGATSPTGTAGSAATAAAAGGATALAPAPDDDIKAALMVLRGALKAWLGTDLGKLAAAITNAATGAPNAPGSTPAGAPGTAAPKAAAPPPDPHLPSSAAEAAGKSADARASAPPPPYRGAPTAAQAAAAPTISADMSPHDIGKVLLGETDAALARQTLLQAASLPGHPGADPRLDPTGPRWNFEVPFMTPQGSTVAQFEISRDGRNAPPEGVKATWRARFSLNLEPIGPVHAQIALTGTRAAVTLWAERPDTSTQLRDSAGELAAALREAELEPSDVLVRSGAPPRPREPAASGRFLDRAS
jgi:hypothetical protein